MTFSGAELRARILEDINPEGKCLRHDYVGPIERLGDIEDLDSYVHDMTWSNQAEREVAFMVLSNAAEMLAVCSDEAGLRRLYISLLSHAHPEFGTFYAGALTLVRRYLYSCIYQLHGLSVARAFERDSLASIDAFWPGFAETYPFLLGVSKAGPRFRSESMLRERGFSLFNVCFW